MIHTVKGIYIVNEAEIDVFLELSCFFDDRTDVGNLISGSFLSEELKFLLFIQGQRFYIFKIIYLLFALQYCIGFAIH